MPENAKHAIVVGAGLAGLAAAVDLVDAGHRVTVLERAEQVGGRTSSWKADGMTVESGLHRFMSSFTATTDLIRRTGTDLEDIVVWEDEVEIITPDGGPKAEFGASVVHRPIKSVGEALGNNDFLPMTEKAKHGKMLAAAAKQHSSEDESLDGLSVQEFALKHGLAEATIDRILAPLTDGLFSVPADQFSMATFMNLTSSYWDTSPSSRVGAFAGPMTEVLAEPIAEYLRTRGATVRTSCAVEQLVTDAGEVTGVRTDDETLVADVVVLASSIGPAQKLVREQLSGEPSFDAFLSMEHSPIVSLQFELAEPLLPQDRSTFGPGTMLGWFAEQSRTTFADSRGRVSIVCTEPEAHRGTDSWELAKQAFEEADRLGLDLRHKMLDFRKIVMPEDFYPPKPGNDAKRPKQRTSINGLVLAGDYTAQKYLGTMEGAVFSGQLAAQAAMAQELSGRVAEPSNLM